MRKIFSYITVCLLAIIGQKISAQHQLNDSLRHYLIEFHQKTFDIDLKAAVEDALTLANSDTLKDSVVIRLINLENLIISVIDDNTLINFRPYNQQMVLPFGEKLVCMSQSLFPKNESVYYARAINNLGMLNASFSKTKESNELMEKAFNIRRRNLDEEHPDYAKTGSVANQLQRLYVQRSFL